MSTTERNALWNRSGRPITPLRSRSRAAMTSAENRNLLAIISTRPVLSAARVARSDLMQAAAAGDDGTVQSLLDEGHDPNVLDKDGRTALFRAVSAGHISTAELLIERGSRVDLRDDGGSTPLRTAVYQGNPDMVHVLAVAGAEIDAVTRNGQTPLMFAVSSFGGGAGSANTGDTGAGHFISHGQAAEQESSGVMAWVKTQAEAYLPEEAATLLSNAGSRIESVGGLAGVFSLAIPEESWQVFSNLGDLL